MRLRPLESSDDEASIPLHTSAERDYPYIIHDITLFKGDLM